MAILKVANVHFDIIGSSRIDYLNDNVVRIISKSIKVPVGNTADRPVGEQGLIRYNSETGTFEGHNTSSWGAIGGVVDLSPPFIVANAAFVHANAAFAQANAANVLAFNTGAAGNAYTNTVGTAGNNYTITVGVAANGWANTISSTRANASNSYTIAVGTAGNSYTVAVGAAGNSYTQTVGAAANTRADTKVASVSGTSGRITSSGGTTPAIDLATAGAGAATYSTGISAITVDAYGRVTSVTGSAGYVTSSGSVANFTSTTQNSQFNSVGIGVAASGTPGELRATDNITAYYSDKRLKKNINRIINALEKVGMISGVTFESNEIAEKYGYTDKKTQVGVLAQEVESILPQIVVPAPFDIGKNKDGTEYSISGENYKTVQYEKLIPLLIEAIKELKTEVDLLKKGKE